MIQNDGIVSTGAGTHSPHPLQVTAKSQKRSGGSPNIELSIGEQKANCLSPFRGVVRGTGVRTGISGLPVIPTESLWC